MTEGRSTTRDLALIATFAGLIGAMGLVPAFSPFGFPVPVTVQSLGVMLAGAVLGARRGSLALLLFLALVAVGLPLLSGGRGGLGVFTGPSAGYLVGFPVAAFVIGLLIYAAGAPYREWLALPAIAFGGIVVLYAIGVPVTAWRAHLSLPAAVAGSAWFLVGDAAKAVIATVVAGAVHRAYPELLPRRRREPATGGSVVDATGGQRLGDAVGVAQATQDQRDRERPQA